MTAIVIPASVIALLERTKEALEGGSTARTKVLPRWLPDGNEIATLAQLAAVLNTDTKTAARCVLDAKNPPAGLLAQARGPITQRTKRRSVRIIKASTPTEGSV